MEAKIKFWAVLEESSLKEVLEASWEEDCPAGLRGLVGFTERACKAERIERIGPESGDLCLFLCYLDRTKATNWKNPLLWIFVSVIERSRQTEQAVDLWFP